MWDAEKERCESCDSRRCRGECEPSFDDLVSGSEPLPAVVHAVMRSDCWACEKLGERCEPCNERYWAARGFTREEPDRCQDCGSTDRLTTDAGEHTASCWPRCGNASQRVAS